MNIKLSVTKKQKLFIDAKESEVLFGGAAGGGKSYGQIVDALLFALRYPRSRQLVLRRTFAELEKSLIRTSLALFPRDIYSFNSSCHTGKFKNGSCIDFGYCAVEHDVYQYQSAEYDCVRFDELTHFTEAQYVYLISRVRGANRYPKQIKSSTNPGGIGHSWVKARFVDAAPPSTSFTGSDGMSRIFIPSLLDDNRFLTTSDPGYKKRLLALPEREKKALLFGDWNIFEGQYFSEFSKEAHVVSPFEIPRGWRKYRTINGIFTFNDDDGLDYLVIHAGKNIYCGELAYFENVSEISPVCTAANRRSRAYKHGCALYIIDGVNIIKVTATSASHVGDDCEVQPYVPTTYINGEVYEQKNLLSRFFHENYMAGSARSLAYGTHGLTYEILDEETKKCRVTGLTEIVDELYIPATVKLGDTDYYVTEIADYAFFQNEDITQIAVANGVLRIGVNAFSYCTSLRYVFMKESVELIDSGAFSNCYSLGTVFLGSQLREIKDGAFTMCPELKKVYYGAGPSSFEKVINKDEINPEIIEYYQRYKLFCAFIPIYTASARHRERMGRIRFERSRRRNSNSQNESRRSKDQSGRRLDRILASRLDRRRYG